MGVLELQDRISWKQAAELLGVSRSTFFRLVQSGELPSYGVLETGRFYLRSDCRRLLAQKPSRTGPSSTRRKNKRHSVKPVKI